MRLICEMNNKLGRSIENVDNIFVTIIEADHIIEIKKINSIIEILKGSLL
jgi:hypothetical protein